MKSLIALNDAQMADSSPAMQGCVVISFKQHWHRFKEDVGTNCPIPFLLLLIAHLSNFLMHLILQLWPKSGLKSQSSHYIKQQIGGNNKKICYILGVFFQYLFSKHGLYLFLFQRGMWYNTQMAIMNHNKQHGPGKL